MMVSLATLVLLLAAAGFFLWRKSEKLSNEIREMGRRADQQESLIRQLTERVFRLEGGVQATLRPPGPPPLPAQVAQPAAEQPGAERPGVTETPVPLPARVDDWETVLGTNWLNRVGALVLVIGIALFLGYSLTHLGPAGKIAIGFAVGLSMLAGGVAIESQERYRNLAPSLIAGGWAVTYSTGYAMHGIPAARVVESAVGGTAILLVISAAMILHALRYRSELATGLAFLFAFVSLNVSALTTFSVIATAVLAASLLYLASRFVWMRLAVAGVALTYLTFVLRYDVSIYGPRGLANGQVTLWIYWLLFEGFDLLDLWRNGPRAGIQRSLFLLNLAGFSGAAMLHHWNISSTQAARFFAIAAVAYLASSFARAWLVRRSELRDDAVWRGGYEGSAGAAAGLMAAALVQRYSGLQMPLALLMEGEIVVLAGLYLRNKWIQAIGGVVLFFAFARLFTVNIMPGGTPAGALGLQSWTPVALLMAGVFTANRLISGGGALYSAGASILIAAVVEAEVEDHWTTAVWAGLSLAALAAGIFWEKFDLRLQAYVGVLATFIRAIFVNVEARDSMAAIAPAAVAAGLFYAAQALIRSRAYSGHEAHAASYTSIAATALLTVLLFDAVQGRLLTVALGFEGAALLIAGFMWRERVLRISGLLLFLLCIAKLFAYDLRELDTLSRILSFVVLGVMLLASSWVYTRFRDKIRRLL
jgi:hypothetical protein